MLDLLADAGPMALPIWAVLLWSVAMYPLGFLFGACSECCDGCGPCNKCNRAYDNPDGVPCEEITNLRFTVGDGYDFAYCFPDIYTREAANSCAVQCYAYKSAGGTWGGPLRPSCEFLDDDGGNPGFFVFEVADIRYDVDGCGCIKPLFSIDRCRFIRGHATDAELWIDFTISQRLDDCTTTSFTLTPDPESYEVAEDTGITEECFDDVYEEFWKPQIEYLKTIPITLTFSLEPCECGACCDGACEENVAEGACTAWQGVGTDCDPDPCE